MLQKSTKHRLDSYDKNRLGRKQKMYKKVIKIDWDPMVKIEWSECETP